MANLTETETFDAGIYQLETTDQVLGGVAGIANTQAKALANRTKYLKAHVDTLETFKKKYSAVVVITGDTVLTAADFGKIYVISGSSGAVAITLPAIAVGQEGYAFAFENKSSYAVNINRASTDTVDLLTTKQLPASGDSLELVVDESATNYVVKSAIIKTTKVCTQYDNASITTDATSYIDLTGLSFTTPNDGITRKWRLDYSGAFNFSTSSGDGADVQILAGASQIAVGKNYLSIQSVSIDTANLALACMCVASIGPNVLVKVRIKVSAGASTNFVNNILIAEEK